MSNSGLSPSAPTVEGNPLLLKSCGVHEQAGLTNWVSVRALQPSSEPVVTNVSVLLDL